ncbi:MurR/RpiR family transcriptional regulator [Labrys wisconsinensis]|uniref:DNA-binding MurR/RpiR family transcriptional regulator n=1 Tax=Labrys wisconsinensis TaxID=425677 RepID=A0ABU0JQ73_9HYPH|nr:MurR/RpiR family transcriptional regulator [Labrys wisconsinensis]MDQ0475424.1 DNA-binding MurR/RpiR family transcriptional regulator [Labrys wisconsinensis]
MPKTSGGKADPVPGNYEGIVNRITRDYAGLSAGFQQIARFLTQNPNVVALESINAVAAKCGTHPSSLVRFAQAFGYSGFKQLQAVFQTRLATAAPGFRERISALEGELSRNEDHGNLGYLRDLVVRDIAALQDLLEGVPEEALAETARRLAGAQTVYIAGQLRSEPIASFLRYLLAMLHRRVVLLDPAGGLAQEMATTMGGGDVLVAIAFRHYAQEVVAIADVATANGTPIIAITDSQLSPLARDARVLFTVPEDEYTFSRSLAAPMCLVQCIAVATAAVLQPSRGAAPRIPTVTGMAHDRAVQGRRARPAKERVP